MDIFNDIRFMMIIILLLFGVVVLGGASTNSPKYQEYNISNSTFQIGSNWWSFDETNSTNNSLKFTNDKTLGLVSHLSLRLTQYPTITTYESDYLNLENLSRNTNLITTNKSIGGIQVKFINITNTKTNESFQDYYFQKNGKYYSIQISGKNDDINELYIKSISSTVEKIISTIN